MGFEIVCVRPAECVRMTWLTSTGCCCVCGHGKVWKCAARQGAGRCGLAWRVCGRADLQHVGAQLLDDSGEVGLLPVVEALGAGAS